MQTRRRRSFQLIQERGTNTRTDTYACRPNNVSSIEKRRETLYLLSSFDPSISLAFSHSLTHPSSPRLLGWMCLCFRSLLQGHTHPSVCRCYCASDCVYVCRTTVCAWVCAFPTAYMRVGEWDCWIVNSRKYCTNTEWTCRISGEKAPYMAPWRVQKPQIKPPEARSCTTATGSRNKELCNPAITHTV